jgi:type 1 glutamine amidotransferase
LVVEHIEKFVCPTVTSSSLLGGPAIRLKEDRRPHVAIIVSDDHYGADRTLPLFADELRSRYGCHCTVIHGEGSNRFPAIEELKAADVAVLYIRRLALPKQQLDSLRDYLDAGRPLVALRTASHAFDVRGESPAGCDQWPEFDAEVLGGSYHGHEADKLGTDVAIVPEWAGHPLFLGVKPARWHSTGSLYRTSPIAADATLLMTGSIAGKSEPLTWTRQHKRARVFYTSLGHPDDFKQPAFRRLLANAIFWAMEKPTPKVEAIDASKIPSGKP